MERVMIDDFLTSPAVVPSPCSRSTPSRSRDIARESSTALAPLEPSSAPKLGAALASERALARNDTSESRVSPG